MVLDYATVHSFFKGMKKVLLTSSCSSTAAGSLVGSLVPTVQVALSGGNKFESFLIENQILTDYV